MNDNALIVDLDVVYPRSTDPSDRALTNMLKGVLEFSASIEARSKKIANDVLGFWPDNEDEESDYITAFFSILFKFGEGIPVGHEYHRCLAIAANIVRQDENIFHSTESGPILWSLNIEIAEKWQGQTRPSSLSRFLNGTPSDPFYKWKNLNHFLSLFFSHFDVDKFGLSYVHLPLTEIKMGLETPVEEGPSQQASFDAQVWSACEWITNCGDLIKGAMKTPTEECTEDQNDSQPGPLCGDGDGITPWSSERWKFWMKRLSEISKDADDLGLLESTKERVAKALEVLESKSD